jgi:hypothetical protein
MKGLKVGGIMGKYLASFVLFLGMVSPLQAGEFAYGLGYTVSHSDNITRVPSNERSEVTNSYLAGFAYVERTTDVVAHLLAQGEFRDYRDDVFGDESIYNVDASAIWVLSPQRFTWTVEDRFEEEQIDATAADTPSNRANVNVFSTGPDFYIRFTPVNTLALGARAGNVSSGSANVDNDRFSGSARWLYQATSISTYSLNFQAMDVNYDDSTINTDFARHDVFLRAGYRPSRSQYVVDLGASRIKPERGQDLDGSLARFSWLRQLTQESAFGVSASGEYSDTGTDILSTVSTLSAATTSAAGMPVTSELPDTTVSNLSSNAVTSDVYYAKRGEIFYNRRGGSFGVELTASASDLDFETTAQDRKELDGRLELDFFYSRTTTVTLFTEQLKTEFVSFVREDTERDSGLRFNYRLSRTVSLGLEGRRTERSSTVPAVEYEENRVFLSVLYSSGPLFSPVSSR